jgi:hypothetical protein
MKNVLFAVFVGIVGLMFLSCTSNWEYKTISLTGEELKDMSDRGQRAFDISDESLNSFGKDGWELVGIYEKVETVHPNYGNKEYVTGLQPNVRTAEISFVFKRKR